MSFDFSSKGRWVLVVVAVAAACAEGVTLPPDDNPSSGGSGGAGDGGAGDGGGGGELPCGIDCSAINAPLCLKSVCNEGQYIGPVGSCVVVNEDAGVACDDGQFCTVDSSCNGEGDCIAGPTVNDCGMEPAECQQVTCNEDSDSCTFSPVANGQFCTPTDLCLVNATCLNGSCSGGTPKDCFFAPVPNECWVAVCDPSNGQCVPEPDAGAQGQPCADPGDLCTVNKTCDNLGNCQGGQPMNCDAFTVGCFNGQCDPNVGQCIQVPVPPGGNCAEATDDCNDGICDMNGLCNPVPTNEGGLCNDFDGCTSGTTCTMGNCQGGSVIGTCAFNDGCCPPGCDDTNDNDCIRPNIMLCGSSSKSPIDFTPPNMSFNLINSCTPDDTVQAFFVTRNMGSINAGTLQTYLQNGGIVLTEWNITDEVFSLAFGFVSQGPLFLGGCQDCFPLVHQFSPNDPFWQDNTFMQSNESGCGYSVHMYPGITPISGWDNQNVSVAYRDLGNGRFWLTDFDWQDGEQYPCMATTEVLMGYMMTHK
jgi:hypothetical protein